MREDVLGGISPERTRKELYATFREPRTLGALLRLQELGVLDWLSPGLKLHEALLQGLPGALEWWHEQKKGHVEVRLVYLAALLSPLGADDGAEAAERRLRVPPPDLKRLRLALSALDGADELLPPGAGPSVI